MKSDPVKTDAGTGKTARDNAPRTAERGRNFITFKGRTQCLMDWSRELDIPSYVIQHRLAYGWDAERALTTPVRSIRNNVKSKLIEYDGKKLSISGWERERGFPRGTIQQRLALDWSVEDAICQPLQRSKPRSRVETADIPSHLTYDGKTMTITEWSEHTGLPRNTLKSRLKNGWDTERALTQPLQSKNTKRS